MLALYVYLRHMTIFTGSRCFCKAQFKSIGHMSNSRHGNSEILWERFRRWGRGRVSSIFGRWFGGLYHLGSSRVRCFCSPLYILLQMHFCR